MDGKRKPTMGVESSLLAERGVGHHRQEGDFGFASEEPIDCEPVELHRMGSFGLLGSFALLLSVGTNCNP